MKKKIWTSSSREVVYETPILSLIRDRRYRTEHPNRTHDFYVLDCVDWVNVIPVTPDDEIVFIELYRHGSDEVSLEIPGGMVDPEDPSPRHAAAREMAEETGFQSDELIEIGAVQPNPAIQGNACTTFLATDAYLAGPPSPDETEDIRVVRYPRSDVRTLLSEGKIKHSLVVAAFLWLELHER